MSRVPHVYVPAPWPDGRLPLPDQTRVHLTRVLRLSPGAAVSYTDGAGRVGSGRLEAAAITRGDEHVEPPPAPSLTVAVAPPRSTARARWVVEKLAELGVDRLTWLNTRYGEGPPPRSGKADAWAVAALEQSRGAHLLAVDGPRHWDGLAGPLLVATPGARPLPNVSGAATVVVGPEAGFAPGEVPGEAAAFGLGGRILRVETAAVVAAALVLAALERL